MLIDMDESHLELENIFSESGPFALSLEYFRPRDIQIEMARTVNIAIKSKGKLAIEAGTGTGKTLAYLVPALLSQKKIIISTGTKALQDQLFEKDLPLVLKSLKLHPKTALLKGRSNYLCLYRLQQTMEQGLLKSRELVSRLQSIKTWSLSTRKGDLSENIDLEEDSPLLPMVSSTIENCLGSQCPDYDNCFVVKARQVAMEADVVVINHYLFFADLSIREDGFGELLPEAEVLIFDESHQLAEIARNFLGTRFSSRQMTDLIADVKTEVVNHLKDSGDVLHYGELIGKDMADWRLVFGDEGLIKDNWIKWQHRPEVVEVISSLIQHLDNWIEQLEIQTSRSVDIENCYNRACDLKAIINQLLTPNQGENVRWVETFSKSFAISQTPLNLKKDLENLMQRHQSASWIFTSATLSVDNRLDHFMEQFSLQSSDINTQSKVLKSPFNYQENTLLYIPRYLPEPNHPDATEQIMEHARELIEMSKGNAFVLLTSYRALNIARDKLFDLPYPLLVQGEFPKNELMAQFRKKPHAVLIATSSFWEGIDVAGEQLKLVIIDRLPFASPSDPIVQSRSEYYRKQGKDPFKQFQIPEAVISLKQGSGRLIRTEQDQGILAIFDQRLVSRKYGSDFIESLPPFKRTRDKNKVASFFENQFS